MNVWTRWEPHTPTIEEVAAAERRHAEACRIEAEILQATYPERAALLSLDADLCEMWADELESGSALGQREYEDALAARTASAA